MSADAKPLIVVRRRKRAGHGHHGGAWKIAYADFVTAMMAFFLLMWLLGSTTNGDLKGIADYFQTPLLVALSGGSSAGARTSIVNGGGSDITKRDAQQKKGDVDVEQAKNARAVDRDRQRQDLEALRRLKQRVDAAVDASPSLSRFKNQLRVDLTEDGLRIQVVDEQNRPMFDSGRAELRDYTRGILRDLAPLLNSVDYPISLAGHTDTAPFAAGDRGYSNWELSTDRANASRRELIAGGIAENKLIRVVGLGPSVPLNRDDPADPVNRRISIVILNHVAQQRILDDGNAPAVTPAQLGAQRSSSAAAPAVAAPAVTTAPAQAPALTPSAPPSK